MQGEHLSSREQYVSHFVNEVEKERNLDNLSELAPRLASKLNKRETWTTCPSLLHDWRRSDYFKNIFSRSSAQSFCIVGFV